MKIKWNGHASFTITAGDGTVIVTDPYEPGCFDGAIKYEKIPDKANIVTVSHDHADHNYVEGLAGSPEVIRGTGIAQGISFRGVNTYHDASGGKERGENTIIVFEVDGIKLCHLGDLGHELSDDKLKEIGKVDILMIPIGGTFTIDPKEASSILSALKPKIAIPMHYKTAKCDFPLASLYDFIHGKEETVVSVEGSEMEITKEGLPQKTKIHFLTHAH